jgi:aminoglycoside 2'-N-acetyltransferase I
MGGKIATGHERVRLRRLGTGALTDAEIGAIRTVLVDAFGPHEDERFTEADWDHAIGGVHFLLDRDGDIVAHASVIEREIHVGDHALRAGYVEAVATAPAQQGLGFGTIVIRDVTSYIRGAFELGVLGTGRHRFYERLGWLTWAGPSFVRTADGLRRTAADDGYILVLTTPTSPPLDPGAPISCEWRPGDVW